jgi:hypothetical protein
MPLEDPLLEELELVELPLPLEAAPFKHLTEI